MAQTMPYSSTDFSVNELFSLIVTLKVLFLVSTGTYNVITDEVHFRDMLLQHCRPPPAKANAEASMIRMGTHIHTCTSLVDQLCL